MSAYRTVVLASLASAAGCAPTAPVERGLVPAGVADQVRADLAAALEAADAAALGAAISNLFPSSPHLVGPLAPATEVVVLIPDATWRPALASWTEARVAAGYTVTVHDLQDELGPGTPSAHEVRDLLRASYADGQARHLLIVGDHSRIPMLASDAGDGEPQTFTDQYYADLTGDWDADGDGVYGEANDDLVDFLTLDMHVGRIPAFDRREASRALTRSLHYEDAKAPSTADALLVAGAIGEPGDAALVQEAVRVLLEAKSWTSTTVYDSEVYETDLGPVPLNPDYLHDDVDLATVWSDGDFAFLYDISHGSKSGIYADGGSASMTTADIPDLSTYPDGSFFFAAACSNAGPNEGSPSTRYFAEELMFTGSTVGVITATNTVAPGDGIDVASGVFAELAWPRAIVREGFPIAESATRVRELYATLFYRDDADPEWRDAMSQNLRAMTLYGDPTAVVAR